MFTMKKEKITKIVEIIFSIYIACVLYLSIFKTLNYIIILPFVSIMSYKTIQKVGEGDFERNLFDNSETESVSLKQSVIWFLIILIGHFFYWLAYYPGGFNLDALGQWDQAHGLMQLNNWHPVLTTAIYWILTRIVDNLAFCIGIQLIAFSGSVVFLLSELVQRKVRKVFLWFVVLFTALNPAIAMNNVCLIKDVPFTILICIIFGYYLKIDRTNGEWLESILNVCILCILLIMLMMVRHNAIFFTIPFVIFTMLIYRKQLKQIVVVLIMSFGIVAILEGPVFSMLHIEQHSNVIGESVGIPMAAMVNALLNDSNNCPEETRQFLLNIATEKEWEEHYIVGEWDSCKWVFGGIELLKEEKLTDIISLSIKTFIKCPNAIYSSVRENTRVIWQVIGKSEWTTWIYIEKNDFGIIEEYNPWCRNVILDIKSLSKQVPLNIFSWEIGSSIVAFFICLIRLCRAGRVKSGVFIIAILFYDFMTMCLLCGPSFRYFYLNLVLVVPILALTFGVYYEKEI